MDIDGIQALQARYPDAVRAWEIEAGSTELEISPAQLVPVCEYLRDESNPRYDLLITLTAVEDTLIYQLASLSACHRLRLSIPSLSVNSVAFVWPAANWAEREAQDLFQATFEGHPNPQPLLRHTESMRPLPHALYGDRTSLSLTRYPFSLDGLCFDLDASEGWIGQMTPRLGYRHARIEDRLGRTLFTLGPTIAARLDAFSAMSCDLAYAMAVEQLLKVSPPPRAHMLRTIYAELQRIASHLFWLARCAQRLSAPPFVVPSLAWQGRETVIQLFQWLGGNPLTPDAISVGGLAYDVPPGWLDRLDEVLASLHPLLDDVHVLLGEHKGFRHQLNRIGIIDPGTALGLGVTGPNLRACGVQYDVRTDFPYAGYGLLDLDVPTQEKGDAYARYEQRIQEIKASLHLIGQATTRLSSGPINAFEDPPAIVPPGTAYASVEAPRGELGVLIVSTGQERPQRAHIRAPSFANLSCLPFIARGTHREQLDPILDSFDLSISEVER